MMPGYIKVEQCLSNDGEAQRLKKGVMLCGYDRKLPCKYQTVVQLKRRGMVFPPLSFACSYVSDLSKSSEQAVKGLEKRVQK